jgi:LPS-assembly protein
MFRKPYKSPRHVFALRHALLASAVSCASTAWAQLDSAPLSCRDNGGQSVSCNDMANSLDWVKLRALPKELRNRRCENCGGAYIDPLAGEAGNDPDTADIVATASNSEVIGNTVTLTGGVAVSQGYRHLSGDEASYDREAQIGNISGNITLREPGVLMRGDRAQFNSETGAAQIENSEFLLHQQGLRGEASELRRDEEGLLHVLNGELSFCPPEEQDWAIRADAMELDVEAGVGTAHGAKFDVGGVPIFYAPWLRFPLDDRRRTGFLWPDIGSDTKGGVDIATPVYFNLAPNYDALYAPRYIEERGLNHEVELRYLNRDFGYWSVGGAFMDNDDRYASEFPEERNHDRWLGKIEHRGLFDQRWRSQVDYAKASDSFYLKDLDTTSLEAKRDTALRQMARLDYLGDDWLVNLEFLQFQSLADDISDDYRKLPQITAQYRGESTPFTLNPIFVGQYSNFDTDETRIVGDERVKGQRLYAEAGVDYPMQWNYGFLTPTLKYRQLEYDLEGSLLPDSDGSPSAGSALASLDGGLFFERSMQFGGKGYLQTLEPRLMYLYSDYEDQQAQPDFDSAELTFSYNQLFRETRFSGRDRLDDANQLSVGVTTRFIGEESGREYLSASLGQIFYFDDRRVRLKPTDPPLDTSGSEMAAELAYTPNGAVNLRTSLIWDPYSGDMTAGNFAVQYSRDNGSVFNLGYNYRRPQGDFINQPITEQGHFSAYVPIHRRWSLFASMNYSFEGDRSIEDMVGVEYDSCCWQVRLLHLRYIDTAPGQISTDFDNPALQREHSTQIQIVLKGMGGFGDRVSGLLEDMIRGFEERENY